MPKNSWGAVALDNHNARVFQTAQFSSKCTTPAPIDRSLESQHLQVVAAAEARGLTDIARRAHLLWRRHLRGLRRLSRKVEVVA